MSRDLELRVRDLEQALRKLLLRGVSGDLGSKETPIRYIYLEDPKQSGKVTRVSWDSSASDWRSEEV